MRDLVAGLFITVDGVTEGPDKWQFDHFDESIPWWPARASACSWTAPA